MTVRWKPLIVLSGLFLIVAVLGLLAFILVPSDSRDVLALAKAEWKAKKYDRALIQFQRVLQKTPKNAEIHEQVAAMYAEWAEAVPARRGDLRARRLRSLAEAAKYGKQRAEPRRLLLADALRHDEWAESLHWARELVPLDGESADAHYVLALDAIDAQPPRLAEARTHLEPLQKREPNRPRTVWLQAQVAEQANDEAALSELLQASRSLSTGDDADPVDRMALLRLRVLDARQPTEGTTLVDRIDAVRAEAERLADDPEPVPGRVAGIGRLLDSLQDHLTKTAKTASGESSQTAIDALEAVIGTVYGKATNPAASPDPSTYQAYAEHLLTRQDRDACLDVVAKGLALPAAKRPAWTGAAMGLRELGVKAALLDTKDETRYDKAAPYIKDLIAASDPLYQGVGHLFQGVIDMERSGLADPPSANGAPKVADSRLQAEALTHLKTAAARLPKVPAAQALYGVALMMSKEAALGRQYLQTALRMGDLEPRYQVWAAWAMIQAGYPEEAVPTVTHLVEGINSGELPKSLTPMLHLLLGEVYQARRTPADLRKALDEYQKAASSGGVVSPALELRIAQVELLLGDRDAGSKRIANVKAAQSGPAAEALAIVVLKEQKKHDEARALLAEARRKYPESDELAGLDAAIHVDEGQPEEADRLLAEFLTRHPDSLDTRLARARVLSGSLQKSAEARKLLAEVADGDHSAPLVQMALIDIQQRDDAAAAQTIAKLRARWKEAAAADLLDAQLSLAQQDPRAAIAHLDEALRKDPDNKLALFWKAQLDEKAGASAEAARVFTTIAKDGGTKEVADGVSLAQAAQWALASMAMENQDLDTAIARYQGLLKQGVGGDADRKLRWQLALAQAAKGEIGPAKTAVATLLSDKNTTAAERVQAANFYRLHDEPALAKAQVDAVLKVQPGHPQAVATAALMLASRGEGTEAARVIRAAIAADQQPPATYLMLAATENLTPPADNAPTRVLAAIDQGLKVYPDSVELIRARYLALKLGKADNPLASVEAAAKEHPTAPVRRLLIEIYRGENELAKAEDVARDLLKESPKDAQLAATLVHLVGLRAGIAADQGDRAAEKTLSDEALNLVRRFRKQFPTELSFPQAECELAARRGDLNEAEAITRQMDEIAPNSPAGPLMRARISSVRGQTSKTAQAYAEALARSPRRSDVRLALGQTNLAMDQPDEAIRQAEFVLESKPDQPAALLMKARGLSRQSGTPDAVATRSAQAVRLLRSAIETAPKTSGFYHEIAEIEYRQGHRTEAVAALRDGLKAVPDDYAGLALLTQYLAEPRDPGRPLTQAELRDALSLAASYRDEASDPSGTAALALAIGFHKAGQDNEALPWIEKASAKLDRPVVHLTFGDILMTQAEATTDPASSRLLSEQAVAQYDKVLKVQASSIEAVNNKAWILHRHLGQDEKALELAQGLALRADPETLPAEFLDTLGSIQAALNKTRDAEETFSRGLRKAPEFAMLNYHMGKLMAENDDPSQAARAVPYLEKARDGRDTLPAETAADVETLLKKVRP